MSDNLRDSKDNAIIMVQGISSTLWIVLQMWMMQYNNTYQEHLSVILMEQLITEIELIILIYNIMQLMGKSNSYQKLN